MERIKSDESGVNFFLFRATEDQLPIEGDIAAYTYTYKCFYTLYVCAWDVYIGLDRLARCPLPSPAPTSTSSTSIRYVWRKSFSLSLSLSGFSFYLSHIRVVAIYMYDALPRIPCGGGHVVCAGRTSNAALENEESRSSRRRGQQDEKGMKGGRRLAPLCSGGYWFYFILPELPRNYPADIHSRRGSGWMAVQEATWRIDRVAPALGTNIEYTYIYLYIRLYVSVYVYIRGIYKETPVTADICVYKPRVASRAERPRFTLFPPFVFVFAFFPFPYTELFPPKPIPFFMLKIKLTLFFFLNEADDD